MKKKMMAMLMAGMMAVAGTGVTAMADDFVKAEDLEVPAGKH